MDCGGSCPPSQVCYATGTPCAADYACDFLPDECATTPTCECVQMTLDPVDCFSDADGRVVAINEANGDSPDCP